MAGGWTDDGGEPLGVHPRVGGEDVNAYDPNGRCPKCGHDDVHTRYRLNGHGWGCRDHSPRQPACCTFEHLDRTCRRCGFSWPETCADRGRI